MGQQSLQCKMCSRSSLVQPREHLEKLANFITLGWPRSRLSLKFVRRSWSWLYRPVCGSIRSLRDLENQSPRYDRARAVVDPQLWDARPSHRHHGQEIQGKNRLNQNSILGEGVQTTPMQRVKIHVGKKRLEAYCQRDGLWGVKDLQVVLGEVQAREGQLCSS